MAFPATPLGVIVELYYSGAWQDITSYVLVRDGITITRGSSAESSSVSPGSCKLTLNNRDGRFSLRNPVSPLYGLIGRNTALRVRVVEGAVSSTRFVGEVSEWPTRWDLSGKDIWAPVEASGILRRLGQRKGTLRSSMRREIDSRADMAAYWPCEDGASATSLSSPVWGVAPMRITGTPALAAYEEFVGSAAVPTMGTAKFVGFCPDYIDGSAQARWVMYVPEAGLTTGTVLASLHTTGTIKRVDLVISATGGLHLVSYTSGETGTAASGSIAFDVNGRRLRVGVRLVQDGSDVDWLIDTYEEFGPLAWSYAGTITGETMGQVSAVTIAPNRDLGDTAIGHVCVDETPTSAYLLAAAFDAHNGETPRDRIDRLCEENGVACTVSGTAGEAMGTQERATLLDLVTESAAIEGILTEDRTAAGLVYVAPSILQNRASSLTLTYTTSGHVAEDLEPVEDDKDLRNDVTVTRKGGVEGRYELTTGPCGTTAVGTYDEAVTLSLYQDDQAEQQAAWRVHLGTLDAPRWAAVRCDLAAAPSLMADAVVVDIGHVITLTALPTWVSYSDERLLVTGYEETLTPFGWEFAWTGIPAQAFDTWVLETDRLDHRTANLSTNITAAATSFNVTGSVGDPPWVNSTDHAGEFPFDVVVGGEVMRVTGISGATAPQTFTVTRSINGVVKAHAVDTAVRLAATTVLALGVGLEA